MKKSSSYKTRLMEEHLPDTEIHICFICGKLQSYKVLSIRDLTAWSLGSHEDYIWFWIRYARRYDFIVSVLKSWKHTQNGPDEQSVLALHDEILATNKINPA